MKIFKRRSYFAHLLKAMVFLSFLSLPLSAYSQGHGVVIGKKSKSANQSVSTQSQKTTKTTNPAPQRTSAATKTSIVFDRKTNTINCDGWEYKFAVVEGSKFVMGSRPGKPEESADGTKAHKVNLETFAIGNIEVPRWLWTAVMNNDPFKAGIVVENDLGAPVNNVSWNDCQTFVSELNKITGLKFALPTEAQWEFAARGGIHPDNTIYSGTNNEKKLPAVANSLGLYSMSGLYKEWCSDGFDNWDDNTFDPRGSVTNPKGSDESEKKVVRGGSTNDYDKMQVTSRESYPSDVKSDEIGFRLVLQLVK